MIGSYLRLIALATGFQKGVKSGHHAHELTSIAMESVDAACAVIRITIDQLAPSEHFIDAIDSNFLYVSFSSAYLLNVSGKRVFVVFACLLTGRLVQLLRPRFSGYLDLGTKEVILQNVSRVIEILNDHGGSVAQSYAKFLKRLYVPFSLYLYICAKRSHRRMKQSGQDGLPNSQSITRRRSKPIAQHGHGLCYLPYLASGSDELSASVLSWSASGNGLLLEHEYVW